MEQKGTVSDTPLTGIHQNFSKLFQHKGITYEKVARAILVDSFSPVPDQIRPESSRWFVNSLSFGEEKDPASSSSVTASNDSVKTPAVMKSAKNSKYPAFTTVNNSVFYVPCKKATMPWT